MIRITFADDRVWIMAIAVIGALLSVLSIVSRRRHGQDTRHGRKRRKARRIMHRLRRKAFDYPQTISYLRKIDPYVFEELVLLSFRKAGYKVIRNRRYSGDGGIDGRMKKDGVWWYVQCKRYKGYICARHVDEFSAMCQEGRRRGVFVHTGRTGGASREMFAYDDDIEVVSGARLCRLILRGEDVLS